MVGVASFAGFLVLFCCVYGGREEGTRRLQNLGFWAKNRISAFATMLLLTIHASLCVEFSSDLGSLCVALGRGVRFLGVRASGERD